VSDPNGFIVCNNTNSQLSPAVAANGTNYLVVWADDRIIHGLHSAIFGSRISSAGTVLETNGFQIFTNAISLGRPAIGNLNGDFLVAWQVGASLGNIVGARVNGSGTVLDSAGFTIAGGNVGNGYPKIAASGTNYWVVNQDLETGTGKVRVQSVTP
jgi:hypothetical protein